MLANNKKEQRCDNSTTSTSSPIAYHNFYTSPGYGDRLLLEKKGTGATTVSSNGNKKVVRDWREFFLSDNERALMFATLHFSTKYVQGTVDSREMRMMGKFAKHLSIFKSKFEHIMDSYCTMCKYKFKENTRQWTVYAIVFPNKSQYDPGRFEITCYLCYRKVNDILKSYQIYPRISLLDVHALAKHGFFNRYIFPLNLDHSPLYTETIVEHHHDGDLGKLMRRLLTQHKLPKERILSMHFSTLTNNTLVKEQYGNMCLQRYRTMCRTPETVDDINCFLVDGESEVATAIEAKTFQRLKGVPFKIVLTKCAQLAMFTDGVITFPCKPRAAAYCNLCKKTKMYYKNPILYCTRCGFTSRYQFANNKPPRDYNAYGYVPAAIKKFESKNEMILYYDINEYLNVIQ
jgi:hypothetical protein